MKQDKHVLQEKKWIKAKKRLEEVWKLIRHTPSKKLETPYQKGWILSLVVREDIARSPRGPILQSIINKFATRGYTRDPKVVSQIRKKGLKYIGKNTYSYSIPYIRDINEKTYISLSVKEKACFTKNTIHSLRRKKDDYFFSVPSYVFTIKIDKNMITHVKDVDDALLKEKAELQAILEPYWRKCGNRYGWDNYFDNRSERRKSKMDLQKLEEI